MDDDESNEFIPEDMETAGKNIRPEFLGGKNDSVGSNNAVESDSPSQSDGDTGGLYNRSARNALKAAEKSAEETKLGEGKSSDTKDAKKKEEKAGGLYSGSGNKTADIAKTGKKFLNGKRIVKLSAFLVVILLLFGGFFLIMSIPKFLIGNLDFNLMDAAGFAGTIGILEEQAEYIEQGYAKKGELPANLANDLVAAGLDVGQVTATGNFVRTNKYIANIEDLDEVAVVGSGFQTHGSEVELAFLFEGELIEADDFVVAVESNPRLYAAFSEGTNITARYYYGDSVNDVYETLGVRRNSFSSWEPTDDPKADQETFNEMLKGVLDEEKTGLSGGYDCESEEEGCDDANFSGSGVEIVNGFSKKNESAAQLLNSAIASTERNKTIRACEAVEEPLQRARIDGDGPVNELMNVLYDDSKEITYTDVSSGEIIFADNSIMDTNNFVAAVSGGGYDEGEARNFSRDRVLSVTGTSSGPINKTVVSAEDTKKVKIGVGMFSSDADLSRAESSAQIGIADANSDTFTTVVGGNYIPQGCADLRSIIDNKAISAMPGDESMVVAYKRKTDERLAKKAEAERATKSPFDVTSRFTFLGSIVYGMANTMVQNHMVSSPTGVVKAVGAMGSFAGNSAKGLISGAIADGEDDSSSSLVDTFGSNCKTANDVGAAGNLYCTQISVIYTGYISKGEGYWNEYIGDETESDYYSDFVKNGTDRWAPFGVRDAKLCENQGGLGALVLHLFGKCFETSLSNNDGSILTGEAYVMNEGKHSVKKASAYTLYDTVDSLLSEKKSTAQRILEEHHKEHPVDTSPAGRIALFTGMTKQEAETAIAYADYLNFLAKYDASSRFAFGEVFELQEKGILFEHSEKLNSDLFCFWQKQIEYADIRNRSFAV